MTFSRIKNLREDNDYKQRQLAEYLCIKQSTYSDYENGNINIPIDALIKLAGFYKTSTDYLLGLTDEVKPYPRTKNK